MTRNVIGFVIAVCFTISILLSWFLFGPTTGFSEENATIYIHTNAPNKKAVLEEFTSKKIINSNFLFEIVADQFNYWEHIQPGKYIIPKGSSLFYILKKLRYGRQNAVNLVIIKYRTKEAFAKFISKNLEADSVSVINFLNNDDSLKSFQVDTTNVFTIIIPDSYSCYWNLSIGNLMRKLYSNHQQFWNSERIDKMGKLGLREKDVYILASIIEEETNKNEDKPIIASVYLNRLKKKMRLSADPTIKFALRNFGLKRIMEKHIKESASSPYNTYTQYGLPPGPICIPQVKTIDAVLDAAHTDYLFFCAKPNFSGLHNFANNEKDHFANARIYRKFLDSLRIK
jgi:UPF0755 protein